MSTPQARKILTLLVCLSLAGCSLLRRLVGPRDAASTRADVVEEKPFSPPTEFVTYTNSTGYIKPHFYTVDWAMGSSVQLTMTGEFDTQLAIKCAGMQEIEVNSDPGKPAVIQFVRSTRDGVSGNCGITAGFVGNKQGDYTLVVGPPFAKIWSQPEPAPTFDELRKEVLERRPDSSFSMKPAERDRELKALTQQEYEVTGKPVPSQLDGWQPLPVSLEPGWCYKFVWKLGAGAKWSDVALRGITWKTVGAQDETGGQANILGTAGIVGDLCPKTSEQFSIDLTGSAAPRKLSHELGSGPILSSGYLAKRSKRRSASEADCEVHRWPHRHRHRACFARQQYV